ncbi:MATE family efflux transporter [Chitinophaga caseinilytica]|uniref:Multidrug-efflux transporter n=1 Tax=Chitinophaga caseinilytica TaxID=2267521 RepID=A0ABZ2ZCG2_9BACT
MKRIYEKYKHHYKDNFQLAYPVVISQLGHTLVGLSDSIIMGHTGEISLAAVSLGVGFFSIFMVAGIGISYGLTPLIAQANGRGEKEICGRLLAHSLIINAITGLVMFAGILITAENLERMGQPAAVAPEARIFLRYLAFSYLPLMVFLTFKQFAEGLGFTRQAMNISIIGNILNIVIGVTLVYGLLGVPRMGISGVGIATFTDRLLMGITMAWYVLKSPRFREYLGDFHFRDISKSLLKKIAGLGTPVALQYIFEVSAFSGAVVMAGWLGSTQQAAHQIAINLASMTYMMASGISAAAGIRSGNNFGAGNFSDLRRSSIASYHMVAVMMGIAALVFVLGSRWLPLMYINDPEVVHMASGLLLIAAFFQLFDGTQVVGLGVLRGLGDVRVPTVITMIAYWVIGLPVGYILGFPLKLGVQGIWWGLLLGLVVASVLLFFRFQDFTRRLERNAGNS